MVVFYLILSDEVDDCNIPSVPQPVPEMVVLQLHSGRAQGGFRSREFGAGKWVSLAGEADGRVNPPNPVLNFRYTINRRAVIAC